MGRFFRKLFYWVSGQFIWGAKALEKDPRVIEAEFDHAIGKLQRRLVAAKDAVGGIVALRERRTADLERLTAQGAELQGALEGAEMLASERVTALREQGKPNKDIQGDTEYKECLASYADSESSLAAVNADIGRVKQDIEHLTAQAKDYMVQLQQMQREIQEVERKKHATIADVSMSTQVQELNDALSGIASSDVATTLKDLEDRRLKARADAQVSRELSGADARLQAVKLRAKANAARAGSKLAAKFGLDAKPEADAAVKTAPAIEHVAAAAGGKGGSLPGA